MLSELFHSVLCGQPCGLWVPAFAGMTVLLLPVG
jgi:hypothetical protein